MKKYLLFDLDGTLTDPKLGICTCVQYALQAYGIEEPDLDQLECFIGPPLVDSFMEFYGMDRETALGAVEKYRERFSTIGKFENKVYKGIPGMLAKLKRQGVRLGIASSKPTVFVQDILKHFRLDPFFDVVVGSELDGTRSNKSEVVSEALSRLFRKGEIKRDQVYMIGDRKFDVEGAKAQRVESVGVAYGYGSVQELMEAHADYVVRSVKELEEFLLRDDSDQRKPLPTLNQRVWTLLSNCLIFYGAKLAGGVAARFFFLALATEGIGTHLFTYFRPEENMYSLTGTGNTIANIIGLLVALGFIRRTAVFSVKRTAKDFRLTHLQRVSVPKYVFCICLAVCLCLGLNILMQITGFASASASYQETVATQYDGNLGLGILLYCILAPFAEEVLFRGILYGYSRRVFGVKAALVISAASFGVFHFNPVQGIYAFIMGLVFAWYYEVTGDFKTPVLMHMLCNTIPYLLTRTGTVDAIMNWGYCIGFLLMAAICFFVSPRKDQFHFPKRESRKEH